MKYFTRGLFASLAAAAVEKGKSRTFGKNIKFFFVRFHKNLQHFQASIEWNVANDTGSGSDGILKVKIVQREFGLDI